VIGPRNLDPPFTSVHVSDIIFIVSLQTDWCLSCVSGLLAWRMITDHVMRPSDWRSTSKFSPVGSGRNSFTDFIDRKNRTALARVYTVYSLEIWKSRSALAHACRDDTLTGSCSQWLRPKSVHAMSRRHRKTEKVKQMRTLTDASSETTLRQSYTPRTHSHVFS